MLKVFNSPFQVTQKFGERPDYYKKYGLDGHEGLDVVPTSSDWTVFSLPYTGQVVKDVDMADKGGVYGIHCTIWYKEIGEAWEYCHLSANRVYIDEVLPPSLPIGTMGGTGNAEGAHLHINRFKVDQRGYRLNKDNGYLGGIDPLPFLEDNVAVGEPPQMDESKQKGIDILDNYRLTRQQGPEGNYEGFVNAIIGSDRNITVMSSQLRTANDEIVRIKEEDADNLKVQKDSWEAEKEQEISQLNNEWEKKLKQASVTDLSFIDVLGLLIQKIISAIPKLKKNGS